MLYLFDGTNINIFTYMFGQTLDTLTKNTPKIAFFVDKGSIIQRIFLTKYLCYNIFLKGSFVITFISRNTNVIIYYRLIRDYKLTGNLVTQHL